MDNIFQPTQKFFYKHQMMPNVSQAPTINVWYPILAATEDVKADMIAITQTNDETAAKDMELRVIVDGETISLGATSVASGASRFPALIVSPTGHSFSLVTGQASVTGFPLYGQSLAIDFRIVTAVGTNQLIKGTVHYQTWSVT